MWKKRNNKSKPVCLIKPTGIKKVIVPEEFNNIIWENNSKKTEDNCLSMNGVKLIVS